MLTVTQGSRIKGPARVHRRRGASSRCDTRCENTTAPVAPCRLPRNAVDPRGLKLRALACTTAADRRKNDYRSVLRHSEATSSPERKMIRANRSQLRSLLHSPSSGRDKSAIIAHPRRGARVSRAIAFRPSANSALRGTESPLDACNKGYVRRAPRARRSTSVFISFRVPMKFAEVICSSNLTGENLSRGRA